MPRLVPTPGPKEDSWTNFNTCSESLSDVAVPEISLANFHILALCAALPILALRAIQAHTATLNYIRLVLGGVYLCITFNPHLYAFDEHTSHGFQIVLRTSANAARHTIRVISDSQHR